MLDHYRNEYHVYKRPAGGSVQQWLGHKPELLSSTKSKSDHARLLSAEEKCDARVKMGNTTGSAGVLFHAT